MPAVQLLPDVLIDQIAAGEVIERPASAVKELVENAFDAGSTRVAIDAENGGVGRIEVADDGSGMSPSDARLALERHATSKIRSLEDLARIGTLGFRGEALPSIASVSRLVLTTATDSSGLGTQVVADRGAVPRVSPARHPKGTRVVVEDLFGNVPARRKFLRSPEAEMRAIVRGVTTLALGRPGVAVTLRGGGRSFLDLPASPSSSGRFRELLGDAGRLEPLGVDFRHTGMRLTGAVTPPEVSFASRAWQWLFVNGRAVKDATISHAARLAFDETLRTAGRHPGFVLFLEIDPALCDVNVHPQKLEVRFRDASAVHALVHRGLVAALLPAKGATSLGGASLGGASPPPPAPYPLGEPVSRAAGAIGEALGLFGAGGAPPPVSRGSYAAAAPVASPLGALRLIGQYRASFLLAEGKDGLVLVDQHVAHERVRYERIRARLEGAAPASQQLLVPVTFDANPEEAAALQVSADLLAASGFLVSELAGRTFVVSSAPTELPPGRIASFLRDFLARAGELPDGKDAADRALDRRRDALAASMACRGAVTINTPLAPEEAARLLADLSGCRDPWTCPHGRPIFLSLDHDELLRRFGRSLPVEAAGRRT